MAVSGRVGEALVKTEYILTPITQSSIPSSEKHVHVNGDKHPVNIDNANVSEGSIDGFIKSNDEVLGQDNKVISNKHECTNVSDGGYQERREEASLDIQPPKKKQKGQNKARPRTVPKQQTQDRICPTILVNEECQFGILCKFSHNVEQYMKTKRPNIGDVCLNFSESGKCRYGIECMFSKQHTTEDFKNIIYEDKYKRFCEENVNNNTLKKDVIMSIRKRQYKFPRSEKYLLKINGKQGSNDMKNVSDSIPDVPTNFRDKKKVDFAGKLYLAPLTTLGNLPFRQICKKLGADITCGEMAMAAKLLQYHQAEWALLKRHPSEDIFGVQICGGYPDQMARVTELLNNECNVDFIDINMGCPIDLVYKKGLGSGLMRRLSKLEKIVKGMVEVSDIPVTIKMRTGLTENKINAHKIMPLLKEWGVDMITLHGRTREQRYTKLADWDYINQCAELCSPVPLFGNGDILSFEEANMRNKTSGIMIARGALIKPWIFTEIKEQRHWDISSYERLELLKDFCNAGLCHWGSDLKGVENTRRFLLEWLSFLHRYIPVGLLETLPQKINERAPSYFGRNDLETLFASDNATAWVKISEMLLGPVPDNFTFIPKHKATSYS